MATGAVIGALRVTLGLDSAAFEKGMDKAQRGMRQTGKEVGALGSGVASGASLIKGALGGIAAAFTFDAVKNLALDGLDYASSLSEQAQQLGITAKAMQEYRYVASQVGISNDEMDQALQRLTRTAGQADAGAKKPAAAFKLLGIDVRDAAGRIKDAGALMPELANALSKIEDPARRAAIEVDIFGKTGQKLDGLLSGGAGQIDALRDAANKLGIVLSNDQIAKADDVADKLSALKQVMEARIASWVVSAIPYVEKLIEQGSILGTQGVTWFETFRARLEKSTGEIDGYLAQITTRADAFDKRMGIPSSTVMLDALAERAKVRTAEFDTWFNSIQTWADETDRKIVSFATHGWQSFETMHARAQASFNAMTDGISANIRGKLQSAWDTLKAQTKAGGDYFHNLWDRVVGHSYIPDMVDGVGAHIARLDGVMVDPIGVATRKAGDHFEALQSRTQGLLDRLFPDQAKVRALEADMAALDAALAGKLIQPEVYRAARARLAAEMDALLAEAESKIERYSIEPADKPISMTVEEMTGMEKAANDNAEVQKRATGEIVLAYARMAESATQSIRNVIDAFKGGDFLDIVGSIADAVGSIFSAGQGAGLFGGARALGGPVSSSKMYLVGERGPELFMPNTSGSIVPNSALRGSSAGGGGRPVMFDLRGAVMTSDLMRQMQDVANDTTGRGIGMYDRQSARARRQSF